MNQNERANCALGQNAVTLQATQLHLCGKSFHQLTGCKFKFPARNVNYVHLLFKHVKAYHREASPTLSLIWNVRFPSAWPSTLNFVADSAIYQIQWEALNNTSKVGVALKRFSTHMTNFKYIFLNFKILFLFCLAIVTNMIVSDCLDGGLTGLRDSDFMLLLYEI